MKQKIEIVKTKAGALAVVFEGHLTKLGTWWDAKQFEHTKITEFEFDDGRVDWSEAPHRLCNVAIKLYNNSTQFGVYDRETTEGKVWIFPVRPDKCICHDPAWAYTKDVVAVRPGSGVKIKGVN